MVHGSGLFVVPLWVAGECLRRKTLSRCENSPKHVDIECQYLKSLMPTCGTDWSMDLLQTVVPIRALFLSDVQRNCLAVLQCHEALPNDYELNLLRHNVKNLPSEDDVKLMERVCGAFNTNSFETVAVDSRGRSASLRALYPMGALQNHCCVPKTRHHFDKYFRLYVYAALPISAGEELTMAYTSLFWDTALRRQFLSSTKLFSCSCHRCSDPTELGSRLSALMCAVDGCNGDLLPVYPLDFDSVWICDRCAIKVNCRQIRSIRSGLAAIIEENLSKSPRQILKFMQTELIALLPANNYLMMNMKFRIVSYFGRIEGLQWADLSESELNTKFNYCNDLLATLDILNCGDCKKKGLILYELYCTNLEKMKRLQQQNEEQGTICIPTELNSESNQQLLEKALSIFQNDVATANVQDHNTIVLNQ
ncbi:hypothetical protein KM043_014742 [Ampulex compressa]|nr:hypothetical protein KM043_014742 [Ampulex compressa]